MSGIDTAMILAAGKGRRMRAPSTGPPKPLISIAGQSLLMRMVARLEAAHVKNLVINVHHKAAHIEAAVANYHGPLRISVSDERTQLLDTGGGVKKALPLLGDKPFIVANGDVLWRDDGTTLSRLIDGFEADHMAARLLLAARARATGYDGTGDYHMAADACLTRKTGGSAPYIFAGVQILTPALFGDMPHTPFSLNDIYDQAQASGRLFGMALDGTWMHVGTPEGRAAAEAQFAG